MGACASTSAASDGDPMTTATGDERVLGCFPRARVESVKRAVSTAASKAKEKFDEARGAPRANMDPRRISSMDEVRDADVGGVNGTTTVRTASGGETARAIHPTRGSGGLRVTPAAEVLAKQSAAEGAAGAELPPLPVPPPLDPARGFAAKPPRLDELFGRDAAGDDAGSTEKYVTLDEVTVDMAHDSGEKARLIYGPRSMTTKKPSRAKDVITATAEAAKGAVAKVAAVATRNKSTHSTTSAAEVAIADGNKPGSDDGSEAVARPARSKGRNSSISQDSRMTEASNEAPTNASESANPFVGDVSPADLTSPDASDSGIPSPRHRRSASGGWSEVSYTTSDDGMLRMCHTSLAPTKPRRWTKGDNLGEGSYGSVWLALNGDTGELFALKEVRMGSSDKHRDESIEQLEQEVNVLSRLVHPNIVRYIGITREETALYIFLEYVPGGSIASLVNRFGKFEENVIRVYTRQILIGLAYLHSQRVVHRDIKGANILVEKSGRIKLADFGMAKVLERVSIGKSFKGSACWMAPEVIRQQNVGFEADIWSVGCTVYEMATGAPPWSDCSTQVQIIFKIASSSDIPDIPEHLSPEGQDFLRLCLQRDPDLRPEAVALLDEAFVLDAHRTSESQSLPPALQYDTWNSSSALSLRDDESNSIISGSEPGSRVNSSRHVAWGDL